MAKRFHRNGRPIYSDLEPSSSEEEEEQQVTETPQGQSSHPVVPSTAQVQPGPAPVPSSELQMSTCQHVRWRRRYAKKSIRPFQGGKPATAYHVADNTPVGKVSAKQFLSSNTIKDELTVYLAKKALRHFEGKPTSLHSDFTAGGPLELYRCPTSLQLPRRS